MYQPVAELFLMKPFTMGYVQATLDIANGWELENARRGLMDKDEVRRMQIQVLVDTGSMNMCINEVVCEALQLPLIGRKRSVMANGSVIECDIAGPLEVRFKNRNCLILVTVLPGDNECLLGAIPLEEMDIMVDPKRGELVVNPDHPDYALHRI